MITINDLLLDIDKSVLISLVDDENRRSAVNLDDPDDIATIRINKAISDSESLVYSYLQRFERPNPIPVPVKKFAASIARKYLYERRLENIPEGLEKTYKDVINTLMLIKEGKLSIEGLTPIQSDVNGFFVTSKKETDREFNLNDY